MNAINHNLYIAKPGSSTIRQDFQTVEWGREANASWKIGVSSNPVFFTADGHTVHLEDSARGSSVMIINSNSEISQDLSNTHTWCINDAIIKFPCKIWAPNRNARNFDLKYWSNQSILKLMPLMMARERNSNGKLVDHSPNCFYYRRHNSFNAAEFLKEETIWQEESIDSDVVSSLKLALVLGYRRIYLATKMDNTSKAYQYIAQIHQIATKNNGSIIKNCGNIDILPEASIDEALADCSILK